MLWHNNGHNEKRDSARTSDDAATTALEKDLEDDFADASSDAAECPICLAVRLRRALCALNSKLDEETAYQLSPSDQRSYRTQLVPGRGLYTVRTLKLDVPSTQSSGKRLEP